MHLRANPVPIPRVDPRSNPIDPFLQLSMDDLMALGVLLLPAITLYSVGHQAAALASGSVGVLGAIPLVLLPPVDGRKGYARLVAWASWLFEPRVFFPRAGDDSESRTPRMYVREVMSDGRRGRRFLLPDPSARAR